MTGCVAGSKRYELRILDSISPLPPAKKCVFYDYTMEAAPTDVSGLPPGLTSSGARIFGTPTAPGTFIGTFVVSGVTVGFSLTVEPTTIVLSPETLPAAIAGSPYPLTTITASGAAPPYTFTVTGLPANGLSYTIPHGRTTRSSSRERRWPMRSSSFWSLQLSRPAAPRAFINCMSAAVPRFRLRPIRWSRHTSESHTATP